MLLYIELEDYLAQWFRHEQGGTDPVRLTRGSIESGLLEQFLQTPPPDYVPDFGGDGKLAIELPNFRNKDTRSYYYLPPKARDALVACIRNRFDISMWQSLHRFASVSQRQDHLIYAFMEKPRRRREELERHCQTLSTQARHIPPHRPPQEKFTKIIPSSGA